MSPGEVTGSEFLRVTHIEEDEVVGLIEPLPHLLGGDLRYFPLGLSDQILVGLRHHPCLSRTNSMDFF
jgi:hypothetical protein